MGIKSAIKKSWCGRYLISELHCVESWLLPRLISDEKAVKRYYKNCTGKELNLENPISFCEKLNWYKLKVHMPLMQQCSDKYEVREYITEKGFGDSLNELYGVYDSVKEIDLDALPDQFVLKAAHGSHMNIVVKDKQDTNWRQAKMMLNSWLHQDIYWSGREWTYKDMPKRIIAEKYLEDETGELRDFKIFCYNGVPTFMQYDAGRFGNEHIRNYYDTDLNLLPITDNSTVSRDIGRPLSREKFSEMFEMAKKLCEPFQFVRTDFYLVGQKIYFGELTFYDGGGYSGFTNEEDDILFGKSWKITT